MNFNPTNDEITDTIVIQYRDNRSGKRQELSVTLKVIVGKVGFNWFESFHYENFNKTQIHIGTLNSIILNGSVDSKELRRTINKYNGKNKD